MCKRCKEKDHGIVPIKLQLSINNKMYCFFSNGIRGYDTNSSKSKPLHNTDSTFDPHEWITGMLGHGPRAQSPSSERQFEFQILAETVTTVK